MPSGKKRNKPIVANPTNSYVHPSLEIRPAGRIHQAKDSVNDRIEYLRRTQAPRVHSPRGLDDLRLVSSRWAQPQRSRVAGPAAPRSWIEDGSRRRRPVLSTHDNADRRRFAPLSCFPGIDFPVELSLLHQTLKALAADFDWHVEYDHIYLSTIPVSVKTVLLSYIAKYGPDSGISLTGLHALFSERTEERSMFTGNESLERLDLGGAIGRAIPLKQLSSYWSSKTKPSASDTIESWESSIPASVSSPFRFPSLTHLSLAHPDPSVSWTDLLTFSRYLGNITHLSLAYWPAPRFPAAAAPVGVLNQPEDDDSGEASYILKQLSRNTPSLRWLSLDGCHHWYPALYLISSRQDRQQRRPTRQLDDFDTPPRSTQPAVSVRSSTTAEGSGAEWTGAWRHVQHLSMKQGWICKGVRPSNLAILFSARGKVLPTPRYHSGVTTAPAAPREPEEYRINAPTSIVRDAIVSEYRKTAWIEAEFETLRVEAFVRNQRPGIVIDFGWDRQTLVAAGVDEQELFEAGM